MYGLPCCCFFLQSSMLVQLSLDLRGLQGSSSACWSLFYSFKRLLRYLQFLCSMLFHWHIVKWGRLNAQKFFWYTNFRGWWVNFLFLKVKIPWPKSTNSNGSIQMGYWQLSSPLAYCSLPSRVEELDLGLMVQVRYRLSLYVSDYGAKYFSS